MQTEETAAEIREWAKRPEKDQRGAQRGKGLAGWKGGLHGGSGPARRRGRVSQDRQRRRAGAFRRENRLPEACVVSDLFLFLVSSAQHPPPFSKSRAKIRWLGGRCQTPCVPGWRTDLFAACRVAMGEGCAEENAETRERDEDGDGDAKRERDLEMQCRKAQHLPCFTQLHNETSRCDALRTRILLYLY